jgi:sugar lactone lactonase YvrE
MRASRTTDVCTFHGEGPAWDAAAGVLRFVDMLAGAVVTLDPATGRLDRLQVGEVAGAWRPRRSGGMVVSVERGFALVDPDGTVHRLPEIWSDPTVRMNDGACDPSGRFYCGSMAHGAAPGRGSLYALEPGGSVARILDAVTISNGLVFDEAGRTAWYIDTPTQRIDVVDVDPATGAFLDRRPFVSIPVDAGAPDGMARDADGGFWVAMWGGGAVHRYAADGRLDAVVEVPVQHVTACCFGGDALDRLYITTTRYEAHDPKDEAGSIYLVEPGVRGRPVATFAG